MYQSKYLKKKLDNSSAFVFVVYGFIISFITYTGTYAFRKPIGATIFENQHFFGVDYKILVLIAQVIGYASSKFIGVKVVSESKRQSRPKLIAINIAIAATALLLFAITPKPYNIIWMVVNGLPLGMIWGIIFTYLEGRKTTELLGAGLATTQVFSSGFVKTVGKKLMLSYSVSEVWMPFITGMIFVLPLVISIWLLGHLPKPNKEDVAMRSKRSTMNKKQRLRLFKDFSLGITAMIIMFLLMNVYRDFRDNFSAEIWKSLGEGHNSEIFTQTELPIFLLVLIIVSSLSFIKDNFLAFKINHFLIALGFSVIGISSLLFSNQIISPFLWMTLVGGGLYIGYIPYQIMLLERFISSFKCLATVSFLILLSDGFGYIGSIGMMIFKNFGVHQMSYLDVIINLGYILSIFGVIIVCISWLYFVRKKKALS